MLKHCNTLSVRSSEIYSTGEVSFHAEGASDQYFLGTQYLLPRWPTLSISTSILVLFHISSMIVGREEVLFAGPTLKWGSICCEANLKLFEYSLQLESYLAPSLSQCNVGKLLLFWEIIRHQNLKIQTNVIHSFYTLCNGHVIGTQRWAHANLWWITNGNGGGAEKELTCKVGRHVSYIIPLSFKILDTSSTLPLQIWYEVDMEDSEFIFSTNFSKKGGWPSNPLSLLLNLLDNALTISIQAPFFSQDQSLHDVDST